MSDINPIEEVLKLVDAVGKLSAKVDSIQADLKGMPALIQRHDSRLDQIDLSLQRGNQKFTKIEERLEKYDARIDKLEQLDGEKAKNTIRIVSQYVLVAIAGAIITNIPAIISALAK